MCLATYLALGHPLLSRDFQTDTSQRRYFLEKSADTGACLYRKGMPTIPASDHAWEFSWRWYWVTAPHKFPDCSNYRWAGVVEWLSYICSSMLQCAQTDEKGCRMTRIAWIKSAVHVRASGTRSAWREMDPLFLLSSVFTWCNSINSQPFYAKVGRDEIEFCTKTPDSKKVIAMNYFSYEIMYKLVFSVTQDQLGVVCLSFLPYNMGGERSKTQLSLIDKCEQ